MLCRSGWAFGYAGGLVVEAEFAEERAGDGVEDAGAFVDAADADVVEFPAPAQGDVAYALAGALIVSASVNYDPK